MKKMLSIVGGMAAVALLLAAVPVQADMVAVDDSELAAISGKTMTNAMGHQGTHMDMPMMMTMVAYEFGSDATTTQTQTGTANIQEGWYQWHDDHATDASQWKGANDQSGTSSSVQNTVVADSNGIVWGAWATSTAVVSSGTMQTARSYAIFGVGGF